MMILAALARYSASASLYTPFGRGILAVLVGFGVWFY